MSAVQVREVVPDVFPTESLARTWNVCEPCARSEKTLGEVHSAKAAVSSLHSSTAPPSVSE